MLSTAGFSSHINDQDHIGSMLDEIRSQEQSIAISKARYIELAHRYGLTYATIGEHLDMTPRAVKRAIRRAAGTPGMEFFGGEK